MRLFGALLIFAGVLVVARRLTAVITLITRPIHRHGAQRLGRFFPFPTTDADGHAIAPPKLRFYLKNMLPSLCLNLLLQLFSAGIYVRPTYADACAACKKPHAHRTYHT